MCCKRCHILFSKFSLKFNCKICVQKEVIRNFQNHILVTWPATNLLILWQWCRFQITFILFRIWPTNHFLKAKSYNFHFHKNDVTWPLTANGLLFSPVLLLCILPTRTVWRTLVNPPFLTRTADLSVLLLYPCSTSTGGWHYSELINESAVFQEIFVLFWLSCCIWRESNVRYRSTNGHVEFPKFQTNFWWMESAHDPWQHGIAS